MTAASLQAAGDERAARVAHVGAIARGGVHPYDRTYLKLLIAGAGATIAGYAWSSVANGWSSWVYVPSVGMAVGVASSAAMIVVGLESDDHLLLDGVRARFRRAGRGAPP